MGEEGEEGEKREEEKKGAGSKVKRRSSTIEKNHSNDSEEGHRSAIIGVGSDLRYMRKLPSSIIIIHIIHTTTEGESFLTVTSGHLIQYTFNAHLTHI